MSDTKNGWPGKPGVPINPEKDGWHWLYNKRLDRERDFKECVFWSGVGEFWQMMGAEECFSPRDLVVREWRYFGPVLSHDQATALQARVTELEVALERLARLGAEPYYGNSDGNMIARAALERKKE